MKIFAPQLSMRKKALAFFTFSLLLLSVYSNSFDCSWHFDDFHNITQNSNVQPESLSWDELQKSFHGIGTSSFNRPFSFFTFALNYYFHQENVFGYHLVNLFIHFFGTVFLFLCIKQAITIADSSKFQKEYAFHISLLASFFWAIHPIQVSTVTYIVQRMALLAGLFCIISLYFYLLARSKTSGRRILFFLISFIAALFAFASKENSYILPISIIAAELVLVQKLSQENFRKYYKFLCGCTLFCILLLFFLDIQSILSTYSIRPFSITERLLTQPRVILKYISLLFFPIDQNFALLHDIEYSSNLFSPWTTILSLITIVTVTIFAFFRAWKYPLACFSIIFFLLNHLIESSVVPLEMIFEHRNYLPSIFIFVLPSIILIRLYLFLSYKKRLQHIFLFFSLTIGLLFSHTTYSRNALFNNEITLWRDNIHKYPHLIRPYIDIGKAYYTAGLYMQGIETGQQGVTESRNGTRSDFAKLFHNLGLQYMAINQRDNAEIFLVKAVEFYPEKAESHAALAQIYFDKGRDSDALKSLNQALYLQNDRGQYHYLHSRILTRSGQPEEAILAAHKAFNLTNNNPLPKYVLGEAYRSLGKMNAAVENYRHFIMAYPDNIDARMALLEIYYLQEKEEEREKMAADIIRLLEGREFEEALVQFNKEFDLLKQSRNATMRAAVRPSLKL